MEFFINLFSTIIFAVFLGVVGALLHEYLGIALFLALFIARIVASIKNYFTNI
ncbi:MAG: hypothetical protein L3J19_09325 [Sulfurimonas sp.]|nr:hypothetical protein [Sulfurimonas sp.]